MTLQDRIDAFKKAFPKNEAAWPHLVREGEGRARRDVLYARWLIGNDYRNKTRFYGAYPHGYLARVLALFPDHQTWLVPSPVLHIFSGSLPVSDAYLRCDSHQPADIRCSVYDLPADCLYRNYWPRLILADPPYTAVDAKKYGTPMVNRGKVFRTLAQITTPGAFVVWLDTCWPMHRKDQWRTVGRIALTRSTNHRARDISIFERVA